MDPAENGRGPAGQRSQTAHLEQGLAAAFQVVHELSQHMAPLAVNSAQAGAVAPPAVKCSSTELHPHRCKHATLLLF